MGRKPRQKRAVVKGYKVKNMPIRIDVDNDLLSIEEEIYSLSETKKHLLRHCEDLTSKYRLRVLYNSKGKAKILYVWENIIAEAVEKEILPCDLTNQEQEFSSRNIHFILTGESY